MPPSSEPSTTATDFALERSASLTSRRAFIDAPGTLRQTIFAPPISPASAKKLPNVHALGGRLLRAALFEFADFLLHRLDALDQFFGLGLERAAERFGYAAESAEMLEGEAPRHGLDAADAAGDG